MRWVASCAHDSAGRCQVSSGRKLATRRLEAFARCRGLGRASPGGRCDCRPEARPSGSQHRCDTPRVARLASPRNLCHRPGVTSPAMRTDQGPPGGEPQPYWVTAEVARAPDAGNRRAVGSGRFAGAQGPAGHYLVSLGTSETKRESFRISAESCSEWWADLEHGWRRKAEPAARDWELRERRLRRRARTAQQPAERARHAAAAEYARLRVRALRTPRRDRVNACGGKVRTRCGCGTREIDAGCGQRWLCYRCRGIQMRRLRGRLYESGEAWRAEHGAGWKWRFLTLTMPHTGNIERDRSAIQAGWVRVRQNLRKRLGSTFPYCLVWEVAQGSDGKGHVHAHVVALWPWVDWSDVRRWFGAHMDMQTARGQGKACANYVCKYVSKGVELGEFSGELAGRVLASFLNARLYSVSEGFWRFAPRRTRCECCGQQWEIVERPEPLAKRDPHLAWRVKARLPWDGWGAQLNLPQ